MKMALPGPVRQRGLIKQERALVASLVALLALLARPGPCSALLSEPKAEGRRPREPAVSPPDRPTATSPAGPGPCARAGPRYLSNEQT